MEKCGNCKYRKKLRRSTYYNCEKYNEIITTNPPEKLEQCINEKKPKKVKKDYIEVK